MFSTRFLTHGGLFCTALVVALAQEPAKVSGPTVKLDSVVVTTTPDYRPLETGWQVGEVPGFRIFSHGNATYKSVAEQLQLARTAFSLIWSDRASLRQFVTVVITADEPEFLAWTGLPANAMDRTTSVVDAPDGPVLLVNGGNAVVHRAAGRGYALALLRHTTLPRWLQEGIAQIVNSADANGSSLTVGRVHQDARNQTPLESLHELNTLLSLDLGPANDGSPLSQQSPRSPRSQFEEVHYLTNTRGDKVEVLLDGRVATRYELQRNTDEEIRRRAEERYTYTPTGDFLSFLDDNVVMPLAKVFDPVAPDTIGWRMNAWGFTHYCLFGDQQRQRPAFFKFVEQLEKAPARPPVEVFAQTFQTSAGKFELNLALYAKYGRYDILDYKLAQPFEAVRPQMDAGAEANVLQLKARVLDATHRTDEARQLLTQGYANPENRSPAYVDQLVELERTHDKNRAAAWLEDAARREKLDNHGRRLLAEMRLERLLRSNERLSPLDLRMVLIPLFAALNQGDQSEETFVLIGRAWVVSAVPPKPEHLNALRLGLTFHPHSRQLAELLKQLEHS